MTRIISLARMVLPAILIALCLAAEVTGAPKKTASNAMSPNPILDTGTVRRFYLDGDFDEAIEILEDGLKRKPAYSHADSVFIFKHLGVMYAAKYETREKGKLFMHQLLMVEPTARILDMYASDMIYMIFKNIQDEFEANRVRLGRAENNLRGNAQTGPVNDPKRDEPTSESPAREPKNHVLAWVGVSTAVVVAGVATFIILNQPPKQKSVNASFQ